MTRYGVAPEGWLGTSKKARSIHRALARRLAVDPPQHVVLEITFTEPAARGNTATNVTKPATVETGGEIQVPSFITAGEKVKIETIDWDQRSDALDGASLLVNTTSLGMVGQPPLDIDLAPLAQGAVVADIVYSPLATPLLRAAHELGLTTVGGLRMLIEQARPGFAAWFGPTPPVTRELIEMLEADVRARAG